MAYRANVGGIMGSGEYMPSAPQIDVAGAINAVSQAFRNNRDDVIRRALMVAQANREQQAAQLSQAEAAQNGILPTPAAHAYVQSNNDAYDAANPVAPAITGPSAPPPVMNGMAGAPTPGPSPRLIAPGQSASPAPAAALPAGSQTDASGRPLMTAPIQAPITGHGARRLSQPIDLGNGYSMIPELTPAARQYEMMDARLRELEAIAQGHDQTKVTVAQGNNATSTANTNTRAAVSERNSQRSAQAHLQGTAMTQAGAQSRHDTPSADAQLHIAATTGMNQTVLQARSHLSDAQSADEELDQLGSTLSTHKGGVVGNYVAGKVVPEMQQANQAGEQFVTLVGPMLNHGRMTAQDIEQVRKTYVPQAGDTPAVIAQKSAARKQILQSLHHQANLGVTGAGPGVTVGTGHAPAATGAGLFDDLPSATRH